MVKVALTDLLPEKARIEIEDIGYLFYRYVKQVPEQNQSPTFAARQWLQMMDDVSEEEWGESLDLNGILGITQKLPGPLKVAYTDTQVICPHCMAHLDFKDITEGLGGHHYCGKCGEEVAL